MALPLGFVVNGNADSVVLDTLKQARTWRKYMKVVQERGIKREKRRVFASGEGVIYSS
ncbi:hypothetical protein COLO4_20747 [Corchorus olitorius]|uniref:Uncharacterized protein n=1 Tax=Corchorus olitorius TaxID=93759 RepID=A0A1R3IX96_9ROSI|nr:hypothetical protein COLO4_20747 [Corchorus olitorius]